MSTAPTDAAQVLTAYRHLEVVAGLVGEDDAVDSVLTLASASEAVPQPSDPDSAREALHEARTVLRDVDTTGSTR